MDIVKMIRIVGAISAIPFFIGIVWLMVKVGRNDEQHVWKPLALFCYGGIGLAWLLFSIALRREGRLTWAEAFFVFSIVFIGHLPISEWLSERGWLDKSLCGLLWIILVLGAVISIGYYFLSK